MDSKIINNLAEFSNSKHMLSSAGKAALRAKIAFLEKELLKMPQAEIPVKHHFSNNVYAREMELKKDTIVVGAIHKKENFNIISKGKVTFFSIEGAKTVEAPYSFVAGPGVKRVIYAHEDAVWTTIHGTSETDIKKIEDQFIAKDYEDFYLSTGRSLDDVLSILGVHALELSLISQNQLDQIPFDKDYGVSVRKSSTHGLGLFADKTFLPGDVICPARVENKRTPAGRYINHNGNPNAQMFIESGDVFVAAKEKIEVGEEIFTDYFFNHKLVNGGVQCLGW